MQENTLKMAAIRAGDYVTYISAAGHRLTRLVEGWRTAHDGRERLLLLDNEWLLSAFAPLPHADRPQSQP